MQEYVCSQHAGGRDGGTSQSHVPVCLHVRICMFTGGGGGGGGERDFHTCTPFKKQQQGLSSKDWQRESARDKWEGKLQTTIKEVSWESTGKSEESVSLMLLGTALQPTRCGRVQTNLTQASTDQPEATEYTHQPEATEYRLTCCDRVQTNLMWQSTD